MIPKTARELYIAEIRRQIFGTAIVRDNMPTGRRFLQQKLKGPYIANYFVSPLPFAKYGPNHAINDKIYHQWGFKKYWTQLRDQQRVKGHAANLKGKTFSR